MKWLSGVILIVVMFCGFALFSSMQVDVAHASTEVFGNILSSTRWTRENSPYGLMESVYIDSRATLTIEPGVIVYLNNYHIQVEGTLSARGNSTNPIYFKTGSTPPDWSIIFTGYSNDWVERTRSGCIIENAVLQSTGISITQANVKLNKNFITAENAIDVYECSPIISNNTIDGDIGVHWASPKISGNSITGGVSGVSNFGQTELSGNIILEGGRGNEVGISVTNAIIANNAISGCTIGIERGSIIRNNTIVGNSVGIKDVSFPATVVYNNLENNTQHNLYLGSSINVTATYNWWGTTSTQAINQTIFDFKNNTDLGTVIFVPFLTAPNPKAPKAPVLQQPEPESETERSEVLNLITFGALIAIPVACGLGLLVCLVKGKRFEAVEIVIVAFVCLALVFNWTRTFFIPEDLLPGIIFGMASSVSVLIGFSGVLVAFMLSKRQEKLELGLTRPVLYLLLIAVPLALLLAVYNYLLNGSFDFALRLAISDLAISSAVLLDSLLYYTSEAITTIKENSPKAD